MLPGDPAAEFAGSEGGGIRDDSDVDVDGLLELDSKGEVVRGDYGEVCMCGEGCWWGCKLADLVAGYSGYPDLRALL